MKELTIEQKAKAYDEAYKKVAIRFGSNVADEIFPELAESDDERIRKELIEFVKSRLAGFPQCERFIAWLKKMGEHLKFCKTIQVGDRVTRNEGGVLVNISQLKRVAKPRRTKPADKVEPNFNFKVGQWIVATGKCVYLIVKIDSFNVTLVDTNDDEYVFDASSLDDAHEWTIADAKDGDVLASELCDSIILFRGIKNNNVDFYCDYDFSKIDIPGDRFSVNNGQHYGNIEDSKDFHPATKEQRDVLMKAMTDAGYIFDFDKKELKKIEQSKLTEFEDAIKDMMNDYRDAIDDNDATIEEVKEHAAYLLSLIPQNPTAWSEEDENLFRCAIDAVEQESKVRTDGCLDEEVGKMVTDWLNSLKDRVQPQQKREWSEEDKKMFVNIKACLRNANKDYSAELDWLKSLRPQKQWKPSEEQL